MKKGLFPLLASGIMGCCSYAIPTPDSPNSAQLDSNETPYLPNSVQLNPNEVFIFSEVNEKTRSGEYCKREVLLGMKGGNLQSVVLTERCRNLKDFQGWAYAQRYEDTDNDGFADKRCEENVKVSYGVSKVTSQSCNWLSSHGINQWSGDSMTSLLSSMLRGVLEVRYK